MRYKKDIIESETPIVVEQPDFVWQNLSVYDKMTVEEKAEQKAKQIEGEIKEAIRIKKHQEEYLAEMKMKEKKVKKVNTIKMCF